MQLTAKDSSGIAVDGVAIHKHAVPTVGEDNVPEPPPQAEAQAAPDELDGFTKVGQQPLAATVTSYMTKPHILQWVCCEDYRPGPLFGIARCRPNLTSGITNRRVKGQSPHFSQSSCRLLWYQSRLLGHHGPASSSPV